MEKRQCGSADLQLSVLGMGCWSHGGGDYWGESDQNEVNHVVRRAVELGINYFDTAEMYEGGRSEEALGQAIRGLPREDVVIGSKVWPDHCYHDTLIEHCEASLQRLGLDHLDLYMLHWPIHPRSIRHLTKNEAVINNPPTIDEALEALGTLKTQGKVRHIGVSNFAVPRLDEARGLCDGIVANQLPYSLITRAIEYETLPHCRDNGVGIIGYMSLCQGMLADLFATLDDVPVWQRRTRHFDHKKCDMCRHGSDGAETETEQALADIRAIATESGMSMAEISIKWAIANPAITTALVGMRTVAKLEANVECANNPLPSELVEKLNAATAALKETLGPSFDYYDSVANDRTV